MRFSFPMYTIYGECLIDSTNINSVNIKLDDVAFGVGLLCFIFSLLWLIYICKGQTNCELCPNTGKYSRGCCCCFWWILTQFWFVIFAILVPLYAVSGSKEGGYFMLFIFFLAIIIVFWFILWCKSCDYCTPQYCNECCSTNCCCKRRKCCYKPCNECCSKCCEKRCKNCHRCPLCMMLLLILAPMPFLSVEYIGYAFKQDPSNNNNNNKDSTSLPMVIAFICLYSLFSISPCVLATYFRALCSKQRFSHFILWNMAFLPMVIMQSMYGFTAPLFYMVLLVPIWVTVIFIQFKELRIFSMDIVTLYLITLDVITDIYLIWHWYIVTHDWVWATLQVSILIFAQIIASSKEPGVMQTIQTIKLTTIDKIMPVIGFGRQWYIIKSWSDKSSEDEYYELSERVKIWELMLESFPSVTLQIYVALVSKTFDSSLVQSILASFFSMTWSIWVFLFMKS
eukprot:226114_1